MDLQESGEMYLETIFILSQELSSVRSVDVASKLGYSKPSISRAMTILKSSGYVTVEKDGSIILTEKGLQKAKKTYERHEVLTNFFVSIGVNSETASFDACKIEHVISDETFLCIKNKMNQ